MREDAAVRRQREDRIKELAVAAGLEDERLAQRLAAAAAKGGGSRDARAVEDFFQNRYTDTMNSIAAGDIVVPEGTTPHQYATGAARQAVAEVRRLFPSYGLGTTIAPATGPDNEKGDDTAASILAQARIALEANPGAREEIERRLTDRGIDPGDL
jgi:hypothetical protein